MIVRDCDELLIAIIGSLFCKIICNESENYTVL